LDEDQNEDQLEDPNLEHYNNMNDMIAKYTQEDKLEEKDENQLQFDRPVKKLEPIEELASSQLVMDSPHTLGKTAQQFFNRESNMFSKVPAP